MDRIYRPNLNQVSNVALGSPWTVNLDIGPAYRYVDIITTMTSASGLTLGGVTDFADLTTVFVNGKPQRQFLATEANKIYSRYSDNGGIAYASGGQYNALIFKSSGSGNTLAPTSISSGVPAATTSNAQGTCIQRIYFEEPWRKSWAAAASRKLYTTWPVKTGGASAVLSSVQIQQLIPSTTNNAGATSLSVYLQYGTDNSQGPVDKGGNPITNFLKWYRNLVGYTASGDQQINNLVKYNKGQVLAILEECDIFSQSTGDDVDRLQVWADSALKFDSTYAVAYPELMRHGFNPTCFDLDTFACVFDANDVVTDGLFLSTPGGAYVNSLNMTATLSAASGSNKTLAFINQVYGPLD
jgi:hypothetical protein